MKTSSQSLAALIGLFAVLFFSCESPHEHVETLPAPPLPIKEYPKPVSFPSLDGLEISANLYHFSDTAPVIVLCHQAQWNKMEYMEIAKTLNGKGFNCLAIDQRSGAHVMEFLNETYQRAVDGNVSNAMFDAEIDILAAVNYASKTYSQNVILWGSSYSATLALKVAIQSTLVSSVIAFSPGEYFKEDFILADLLVGFDKPVFVTSNFREAKNVTELMQRVTSLDRAQYIPESPGSHGSRALWRSNPSSQGYWDAVLPFLERIKNKTHL